MDCQLSEEFGHIHYWALKNKMTINKAKTKKMVFHRPHPTKFDMPHDPLDGIAQEHAAKLLGVIITGKLSFEDHVDYTTTRKFFVLFLPNYLTKQMLLLGF